jgi:hypothetical protein
MRNWYNVPSSSAFSWMASRKAWYSRVSCVVKNAVRASVTHTTTSHLDAHSSVALLNDPLVSSESHIPGMSKAQNSTPSSLSRFVRTHFGEAPIRLVAPTRHASVVVRHIPDSRTRFPASALTIVDFPALGRPAKPSVSMIVFFFLALTVFVSLKKRTNVTKQKHKKTKKTKKSLFL